jgi:hypothetical protein
MAGIFEFWSDVPLTARHHPADAKVLSASPTTYAATAYPSRSLVVCAPPPIVLLFLSPGFSESDIRHAESDEGQRYYRAQRTGDRGLPSEHEHLSAWRWWTKVVRQFGLTPEAASDKVAILNIGAYKSAVFRDWHMLTALPSSRVTLTWAQSVLFPPSRGW